MASDRGCTLANHAVAPPPPPASWRAFAGHRNHPEGVGRVTSGRARRHFRRGNRGWRQWPPRVDEGGFAGLWGTRGHLSVNGFCNWESVKLPNRPVHLVALLAEPDQTPSAAATPPPFAFIYTDCPGAWILSLDCIDVRGYVFFLL
jgi:hypothetical protein